MSHSRPVFCLSVLSLLLAACAPPTRDVTPMPMPADTYANMDCQQLARTRTRLGLQLVFSGLRQDQVAHDDNIRTLGFPSMFGTFFEGNGEQMISYVKGELHAVDAAIARSGCAQP